MNEVQKKSSRSKLKNKHQGADKWILTGQSTGPDRSRDRSSDRSPLFPSYNEGESRKKECSENQKYGQLEEGIRRILPDNRPVRTGPGAGQRSIRAAKKGNAEKTTT